MKTSLESENLKPTLRATAARLVGSAIFYSLLALIALVAIPYGTAEPWWKALFQCVVFILAGVSVIQRLLSRDPTRHDRQLLLPILVLISFALLQTWSWRHYSIAGVDNVAQTISVDPFQTRLFVSQLLALLFAGSLLVQHTTTHKRLRRLVELIIAVGVISAGFGILRQASQHEVGFGLPYLVPGFGYGQFINANHFAFLMEMALGLVLGIVVCRGVAGKRRAIYLMAAIPMWAALILANSRAGIFSIFCQLVFFGLLISSSRIAKIRSPDRASLHMAHMVRGLAVQAILVTTLLGAALITVIVVGGSPFVHKLAAISVELDQKTAQAYTLRLNIWQATWALIKDHPITGVGFGGYWAVIPQYHHGSGEYTPQEAHNDYLELLASGGLLGVAIGAWFIVAFFRAARRKVRTADNYNRAVTLGALAGILPVALHSFVDYGLHITINALVLTALISVVVINTGRENANPADITEHDKL